MRNRQDHSVCGGCVCGDNICQVSVRKSIADVCCKHWSRCFPILAVCFWLTAAAPMQAQLESLASNEKPFKNVIQLKGIVNRSDSPVVTALSVSPDGEWVAAAGDDHAIRIVSIRTGVTTATLEGHSDWVQSLAFSESGHELASCGNDGTLRTWALGDSPRLTRTESVGHALLTLTYVGESTIYTAGFGDHVYVSTNQPPKFEVAFACECKDVRSITSSPNHQWIAYSGRDGVLRIRRIQNGPASSLPGSHEQMLDNDGVFASLHFDRIRAIRFSDDSTRVTSVGEDRRVVHYNLASQSVIGKSVIGGGKLMGLCLLSENLIAIAGSDNSIRLVGSDDQQPPIKLVGHDGSVSVLCKAGDKLISGSFDTTIRIWDIAQAIADSKTQGRYVHPVAAQFEDSGAGDAIK